MNAVIAAARDAAALLRERPIATAFLALGAAAATTAELAAAGWTAGGTSTAGLLGFVYVVGALGVLAGDETGRDALGAFWEAVRRRAIILFFALLVTFFLMAGASLLVSVLAWLASGLSGTALPGYDLEYGLAVGVPLPMAVTGGDGAGAATRFVLENMTPQFALFIGVKIAVLAALQFVDAAVVLDDQDMSEAIKTSGRLFVAAPVSTIAYALVRTAAVVATIGFPSLVGAALVLSGSDATAASLGGSLPVVEVFTALVLAPLGYLAVLSYHVAYYQRRTTSEKRPPAADDDHPAEDRAPA